MVFKIGNQNFTSYVQESTYKMDAVDRYKTYTDGKNRERRKYYARGELKGTFDMVFTTSAELTAFKSAIDANTSSERANAGRVSVTATVSSTNAQRATLAFVTLKTKKRERINASREYIRITVEVVE